MKEILYGAIRDRLAAMGLEPDQLPRFVLEPPRHSSHGDLASNVAMVAASKLGQKPRQLAEKLAGELKGLEHVQKVEVAGPGFLNFFIDKRAWQAVAAEVLEKGADFGRSTPEKPERILVEFVSANPTGPLHFGHGRGAVVGDVLASLYEFCGNEVVREYYVNDAGAQVEALVDSIVYRLRVERGLEAEFPADGYRGSYVDELARSLPEQYTRFLPGTPGEAERRLIRKYALDRMLEEIDADLRAFGVRMDVWSSEADIVARGKVAKVLDELERRGHVERREGALWFMSDRFGDSKPRVLVKSNGLHTYFATDIAYHVDKLERGFDRLVNVWGADHHGYVPRMKAGLQALGADPERLQVVLVQMVSLLRDGKPVVLSKRAGEIVTLRDVIDEVGRDAARYFFLLRGPDSQMDFDLELAKKKSLENPVFYVQYGHARLCSILARANERGIEVPEEKRPEPKKLLPLELPEEIELLKKMSEFAELIKKAASTSAPQLLVYYLQDLVGIFHRYYTAYGRTDPILGPDVEKTTARLYLVLALRRVLSNALGLLGVSAPEYMESPDAGAVEGQR